MTRHERIAHMAALLLAHGQSFTAEHAVSDAFELDREICRRLDREDADLERGERQVLLPGSPGGAVFPFPGRKRHDNPL